MAESTYFVQECPTCGRNLRVRVEYLGRSVVCQHCRGKLMVRDPAASTVPAGLMQRAEELLELAERRLHRPR